MAKQTAPFPKLSDTQLVLLSTAIQRADGALLPLPKTLKARGAALNRVITTLSDRGLIVERQVAADIPAWQRDDEGRPTGLFLTEAGAEMLGPRSPDELQSAQPTASRRRVIATKAEKSRPKNSKRLPSAVKSAVKKRRASKQEQVVQMLRRKNGASLDEIANATGWQAHTVRGFLSAVVRKKLGLTLIFEKTKDGVRRYHIAAVSEHGA